MASQQCSHSMQSTKLWPNRSIASSWRWNLLLITVHVYLDLLICCTWLSSGYDFDMSLHESYVWFLPETKSSGDDSQWAPTRKHEFWSIIFLRGWLMSTSSPSSDDPDGNGLLQLPWRSIDDITTHFNPLATHPWPVKDIHLKKYGQK